MHVEFRLLSRIAALLSFLVAAFAVTPVVADTVPPGKSVIYLITRDTGEFGSVVVSVNGRVVGSATSGSHLVIFAGSGGNEIGSAGSGRGTISLTTVAGGRYYVTHRIGASGAPEFRVLSEADGQAAVAQTRKLAEVGSVPSAVAPAAAAARESQPDASPKANRAVHEKQAVAIILKSGSYKLAEEQQPMVGTIAFADTQSSPVMGFEVEWRHPKGFAAGGEIFYFKNEWTDDPAFPPAGDIETAVYTVNGKYYFDVAHVVYPYVGLGLGYAISVFNGAVTGDASGFAYQAMAGVEFRFKYVGLNLQYKRLTAKIDSELPDGTKETNDLSGSGGLFGLTIHIPIR